MEYLLEIDKLILFLILFIPGFVSLKIFNLLVAVNKVNFSESLFEVVGYSVLNFIILLWPIVFIHKNEFYESHAFWYYIALVFICILFPVFWGVLFAYISKSKRFKFFVSPVRSAWDSFFLRQKSYWVIVNYKDGSKIGGKYGKNSCSSAYPSKEQIYLEEMWDLNEKGYFKKKRVKSHGVLILGDEINSIEFYKN